MTFLTDPPVVRYGNAVLASVALLLLAYRAHQAWRSYTPRTRLLTLAMSALLLTGAYGSVEAAHQHAPLGFRTYMAGVAYMWVLVALTITPPGLEKR